LLTRERLAPSVSSRAVRHVFNIKGRRKARVVAQMLRQRNDSAARGGAAEKLPRPHPYTTASAKWGLLLPNNRVRRERT